MKDECSWHYSRSEQFFDAAASWSLQSRNYIPPMVAHCIFLMGLSTDNSQASRYSETVHNRNHAIKQPSLSAPPKKRKEKETRALHLIGIPSEPLVLKYDSLTLQLNKMEMEREGALCSTMTRISLVISQDKNHRHE